MPVHTGIQRLASSSGPCYYANIPCSKSKFGRKAAFCRDYDGNAVELVEKP